MPTFTVISQTSRMGLAPLTASPLCAIPGRVEVYGLGVHVAYPVEAADADAAMAAVRDAVQIVGGVPEPGEPWIPAANRWTVIGTADNGSCPSWTTVAVVAGEHEVQGRWDSMLSHRWDYWEIHRTLNYIRDEIRIRRAVQDGPAAVGDYCGVSNGDYRACGERLGLPDCRYHRVCGTCGHNAATGGVDHYRDHASGVCPNVRPS